MMTESGSKGKASKPTGKKPAERERMIAEAAYYRAERRGFSGGDTVKDWLAAEKEVDHSLRLSAAEPRASVASPGKVGPDRPAPAKAEKTKAKKNASRNTPRKRTD
jgi:hypothetical protein